MYMSHDQIKTSPKIKKMQSYPTELQSQKASECIALINQPSHIEKSKFYCNLSILFIRFWRQYCISWIEVQILSVTENIILSIRTDYSGSISAKLS